MGGTRDACSYLSSAAQPQPRVLSGKSQVASDQQLTCGGATGHIAPATSSGWDDGRFGLTQVRLSSWFPFDVQVVLNGREWLARQMDAKGIGYQQVLDWCGREIRGDKRGAIPAALPPILERLGVVEGE